MNLGLRWKILLFTALAPVVMTVGTLWTVNHSVSIHLENSIHDNLRRSSRVFENMLSARANALDVAAQVIVRDPRFFSVLALPASPRDPEFRATMKGVARDFHAITHSDLFEVVNRDGAMIASVGAATISPAVRKKHVGSRLGNGRTRSGILVTRDHHYQYTVTPVVAGGRVVGALVLGAEIGDPLANQLRGITHGDVTFISGTVVTGSTLTDAGDLHALRQAVLEHPQPEQMVARETVFDLKGSSGNYLTLVRRIPGSDPLGKQLYVMQRSLDVESAFMRRMREALLQLGGVAILVALIIGFLVSIRITHPVRRLVRGAEEMEQGNYDYPLEIRSRDEIGYLAQRFVEMRLREKNYVASLEDMARFKSEFISVAAHELRTPISVIKGFTELFAQGVLGATSPPQREALEAMDRSIRHLTRIAEDATRVAQIEGDRFALSVGEHDVETVVRQSVSMAAGDAPNRNIEIRSLVEPDLGVMRADGQRLVQAIANLVRNGIRFTPDGGRVDVHARRDGGELVVEVQDTGIGISEDRLAELLTRGAPMRDSLHHHSSGVLEFNSAGLGLGLRLARGIAEAHGGRVEVRSQVGVGSTFTLRLPFGDAPDLAAA